MWQGIGYLLILGLIFLTIPHIFLSDYESTYANKISVSCLWFFFVLINAYYGGALTMFFVSEISLPFQTMEDVLKLFPSWNLVFLDGNDNFFKLPASQVNHHSNFHVFFNNYKFLGKSFV